MKIFCTVALFACLFIACEKDNDDYEPVKPPIEQPKKPVEPEEPEKPDEPTAPPSTDDIINIKIGDLNMIVGSNNWNAVDWMLTLFHYSSKKGYSIRKWQTHSAIIFCRKEERNIRWYFINVSADRNRALMLC